MDAKTSRASLFWKIDEDGERVHRLQSEWDGNKGAWRQWERWRSNADNWNVSIGATWARWGIAFSYEWCHETAWNRTEHIPYRRQWLSVEFGPWYVGWMRCKPVQSLIRPEPLSEMVCVRMTAATKARLTREGALQGRSNPDLGRIAIEQMLDAQDLHRMQEAGQ